MEASLNRALVSALALLVLCAGCSTVHETVKDTKRIYNEYVVPKPEVVLDNDDIDREQLRLARLFKPVDEHINDLRKYIDGTDRLPNEDWFKRLFTKFGWISGVMVTDVEGVVRFQHPQESLKRHDLSPFVEWGEAWHDHKLRAFAVNTPLGPEIYLANPFFEDSEWVGLIVVHFDPRKLLRFCPAPDELIIVSQDEVVWPGDSEQEAQALAQEPWEEITKDREFGTFEGSQGEYYWIARHLGFYYLIYASLAEPYEAPEPPAQEQ